MQTHDIGRVFVHTIRLKPGTPLFHRAITNEIEEPFRIARPFVFRFWPGRGLVLGLWVHTGRDEDSALLDAIDGYTYSPISPKGGLLDEFLQDADL